MLINNVTELKAHLGTVHKNLNPDTLLSFISQAEQLHLVPVLGEGLVEQLGSLPAQNAPAHLVHLRDKFCAPLAYYIVLEAAPFLQVGFGELGLVEQSTERAAPSRQWVYNTFVEAAAAAAEKLLDIALAWLDARASTYAQELDSSEYRSRKRLIVGSAAELGRYVATGGSRRFYLALLPTLRQKEDFELYDILGEEQLELLRDGLASGEAPSAEATKLLELVRPLLAHLAFADGILSLSVALTGTSLRLLSDNEAVRQRQAASSEAISALSQKSYAAAERYQARLVDYLDKQHPEAEPQAMELQDNSNSPTFWV